MKILVAEDNRKTADYLHKGLSESGFIVEVAGNGADAMHLALTGDYDLITLDIMLPQSDGWSILKTLRNSGSQTPVLVLTACDSVPERVRGLELGADDYLVKPFAFSEFLARVQLILRRAPSRPAETLRIADLRIDLMQRKVTRAGERIHLSAKEFAVLELLARRAGEILSRTQITEQVWDMNFDSDTHVVDVAVWRLRNKIDDPYEIKLIHSVRGMGYVLEER